MIYDFKNHKLLFKNERGFFSQIENDFCWPSFCVAPNTEKYRKYFSENI